MNDTIKKYEELEFSDDTMFTILNEYYPNITKGLIKITVGIEPKELSKHKSQYSISNSVESKSIRYDVYVEDKTSHKHYDIEMQTIRDPALAERARYYASMMDSEAIKKGQDYASLASTYIIFICTFNPFPEEDEPIYYIESAPFKKNDNNEKVLCDKSQFNDRCVKILVNTKVSLDKVNDPELRALIEYINTKKVTDEFTREIDNAVKEQRQNSYERSRYMTFEQELRKSNNSWYQKGIEQGIEQGVVQGIDQGILLQKKDDIIGMKAKGLSISDISDVVKLSIDQVNEMLATNSEESSTTLPSR